MRYWLLPTDTRKAYDGVFKVRKVAELEEKAAKEEDNSIISG